MARVRSRRVIHEEGFSAARAAIPNVRDDCIVISTGKSNHRREAIIPLYDELRAVKVQAKGRVYYYAWRGGPRLCGDLGSLEFIASFNQAIENRKMPDSRRFYSLVVLYKSSSEYQQLAASTVRNWSPWLDRIAEHFGDLSIAQFDRPEKIRPIIRQWRSKWPIDPAPPTTECKFVLASFPMLLSSAKLPQTLVRA
jgi:hypothetical protein